MASPFQDLLVEKPIRSGHMTQGAGGRRQEAGGRRQEAGGRRQREDNPASCPNRLLALSRESSLALAEMLGFAHPGLPPWAIFFRPSGPGIPGWYGASSPPAPCLLPPAPCLLPPAPCFLPLPVRSSRNCVMAVTPFRLRQRDNPSSGSAGRHLQGLSKHAPAVGASGAQAAAG